MSLTKAKLNDMWRAGYCRKAIEGVRHSNNTPEGAQQRLNYLKIHIQFENCPECHYANLLKGIEQATATAMGPAATTVYNAGGDITTLDRFHEYFDTVFAAAIENGTVTHGMQAWIAEKAHRGDYGG